VGLRILIVGAGIAGLTAALQLSREGYRVSVMERRRTRRSEGYMIDFFGSGYDVAEKLGLIDALAQVHYQIDRLTFVDANGRATADLPYPRIREAVFRGRHFNFMRGDLEQVLLDALKDSAEIHWGVTPMSVMDLGGYVTVHGSNGSYADYDLVIGADGVHSAVRSNVFGPGSASLISLECHTVSYVVDHQITGLPNDAFISLSAKGMTAGVYPLRGCHMATFFIYSTQGPMLERSAQVCRLELEQAFRGRGWRVDDLLDTFPEDGNVYFDEVLQVDMRRWSKGRVVLIGDACGCVSLLAGQGATIAMTGGYLLAQELQRSTDHDAAFRSYEARMRPMVTKAQRAGRRNTSWFLPSSAFAANTRNRLMNLAVKSPLASLIGRSIGTDSRLLQ